MRACEVSFQLFAQDGYEGFSLRSLARALGCSHATPYRYFDGKADIFATVRAEGFRRFGAFLRGRLEGRRDPVERVRALARGYFDFALEQRSAFTIVFEMNQPDQGAFPFVDEAAFDAWSVLRGVIHDAVTAGALQGEVDAMAHTMWAGIHGVATLALAHKLRMGRGADAVLAEMTETLIRAHAPGA